MSLQILLTTPSFPPFNSGLGNAVQQQAALLAAEGFSVVVATGGEQRNQRRDELSGALIEEFCVQGADCWQNPLRGDTRSYEQFLVETNFDVVLMNAWQTWSTDLCFRNLRRMRGRKFLYSHCLSTNLFFPHQPLRSLIRYLLWRPYWWKLPSRLRSLDGLIFLAAEGCDSRFDDLNEARRLGVGFRVVPNALSSSALEFLGRPVVERKARSQLIAIGSYDWQKGHDFVLRAYAQSSAMNRIPLKIFGQTHSNFSMTLRKLAIRLGIADDCIQFHEGVGGKMLLEECSSSIAFLSGSHTECQPLVLLDSMAVGTPFVARGSGCIPYFSGGLVANSEVHAAQTIDRLLLDEAEWNRLSDAGREYVAVRCHPVKVGRDLVAAVSG